jgi:hypothetical protein
MTRRFAQLPSPKKMRLLALQWATKRDQYLSRDLKEFPAASMNITAAQRDLKFPNGMLAFDNYVDWVTAYFTHSNIHVGLDGQRHTSKTQPYCLTEYGRKLASKAKDGNVLWPPWFQHGQRA